MHQITVTYSCVIFFLANWLFFFPHSCLANQQALELDITKAVEMAKKNSRLLSISKLEIAEAEEEIEEIFGTFRSPQFELISYGGLISDARGDLTNSPDTVENYDHLGPFVKVDMKAIQPFYSFGKYGSAMEAGRKNLEMKKAMFKESVNNLSFKVTQAFLSLVASHEGSKTGKELLHRYKQLLLQIQELQQNPDSGIDFSHVLEARAMFFDIAQQGSRPDIKKKQALLYLNGLLDIAQDTKLTATPTATPELSQADDLLVQLLDYFRTHSPVIQSYEFGLKALSNKADLEVKRKYPDLFVALGAGYGTAPDRDKQINPFITDDYNYERIGAVLGLKWDFNFHVHSAKEQKAAIEYQKIVQKKHLALLQMNGLIRKFFGEALRYQNLLHAAAKSLKAARTWLRLEGDNLDLGIGDVRRLVKAYQSYYRLKGDEIETRYQYLMSLAQLAKTVGDMNLFFSWIQNGKVQLQE